MRCCPPDFPYWWESDQNCHASAYQQKSCSVPDGSSSECDCNSNSDCPSSYPFCQESYPSPISDGYDACVSSQPEYCGNGVCASSESYYSCQQDCSSSAPSGSIDVDVRYSSGANANSPIPGAYVYLDGSLKATTSSQGKASFSALYGQRTVKVSCPDSSLCEARTVNVDGSRYLNFGCSCTVVRGELLVKVRSLYTSSSEEGYPVFNVYVFLDGSYKGLTNQFGNLYISNVNQGSHKLGLALNISDEIGSEPYEHRYSADLSTQENFSEFVVNIMLPEVPSISSAGAGLGFATVSRYNSSYVPDVGVAAVLVGAVVIGFAAWSYVGYAKCVEETDDWWSAVRSQLWHAVSCNAVGIPLTMAVDKDLLGNCMRKSAAISRNTFEKCKLEFVDVVLSVIPGEWVVKATGKVFVTIKGAAYSVPYVEKYLGYSFKVIKESDVYIKLSDGASEFGYKVTAAGLKIQDNIVGLIAKIFGSPEVSAATDKSAGDFFSKAKFPDLGITGKDRGNIKGALGQKVWGISMDTTGEVLIREGESFFRPSGPPGKLYKENSNFKLIFNKEGKLDISKKPFSPLDNLGDLDDFYVINDKPIAIEVKTQPAANFDKDFAGRWVLSPQGLKWEEGLTTKMIKRLNAVKDVTGKEPEFIFVIPKGEFRKSKYLPNFLADLRKAGFKNVGYIELPKGNVEFDKVTKRIFEEVNPVK
ncbi:hypothetical protein HYY74_02295 [Candidatus Woesearchaeota archaeon]|nr:hypothetical protein [Candidatus Woesearchaeota archaeon]